MKIVLSKEESRKLSAFVSARNDLMITKAALPLLQTRFETAEHFAGRMLIEALNKGVEFALAPEEYPGPDELAEFALIRSESLEIHTRLEAERALFDEFVVTKAA